MDELTFVNSINKEDRFTIIAKDDYTLYESHMKEIGYLLINHHIHSMGDVKIYDTCHVGNDEYYVCSIDSNGRCVLKRLLANFGDKYITGGMIMVKDIDYVKQNKLK